jgi:hypothetical protein
MYGFYAFLWWIGSQPPSHEEYERLGHYPGDSALATIFVFVLTTPFFLAYNIISMNRARKKGQKKSFIINLIGLIICILNVGFLYFITNGFR